MFKLVNVYRNEEALKKYFLKETDEREIFIRMKSGAVIVPILSMIIVVLSFIVAYFSYEAFFTMEIIALVQIIVSFAIKSYWHKKI